MKLSIITVVFNGAETIEQTIKSVLSQDFKDIEYIVVDGGSTDGTLNIINRYKNRIAKVISEPDNGIYHAMNKGLRASTGDILATLNGDDLYAEKATVTPSSSTRYRSRSATVCRAMIRVIVVPAARLISK